MITFIATNVVNSFSSAEEDNETADNSIPNDQEIEQIYKKYKIKKSATEFQFRAFYRKHATDMDIDSIGYKLYLLQLEQDIDKICTYKGWDRSSFKKEIFTKPQKKKLPLKILILTNVNTYKFFFIQDHINTTIHVYIKRKI